MNDEIEFKDASRADVASLVLEKHYSQRMPPISRAFIATREGADEPFMALTIGKPASRPLCVGIAGVQWAPNVFELNRLVTDGTNAPNELSWFVARSLRALADTNMVIVSFADTGAGHNGYIYQATNWDYLGESPGRTDRYMPGGKHPRHYTDEYLHLRKVRTTKHRYVHVPNRRVRRAFMRDLRYTVMSYPKGANSRYELGTRITDVVYDRNTGLYYADAPDLPAQIAAGTAQPIEGRAA